ncbi:MAG TPA: VWA domain-containing protein [Gemmatimonadaceae bacterium]|nr:VWA domain-containing protein [Gemmatimonadaceae bacterium]
MSNRLPVVASALALLVSALVGSVGQGFSPGVAPGFSPAVGQFKSGTSTVALYATVTDADKRLVPDLEQSDFEVYDNGKKQAITLFENKNTPVAAIVMLDSSGSMTLILDRVKSGAEQFLLRLLPDDTGQVGAFNDKIQFLPESGFTSDRDLLVRSLRDLDYGYPTRLWDAVDEGIRRLDTVSQRKVVLVFTDGADTASRRDLKDVMNEARAKEIMVYAIGLETKINVNGSVQRSSPDRGLKKLAEETGGGFLLLGKEEELGPTFTRVAQEIHSQYVLGFTPPLLDGKVHKLEVKIRKPGMNARARKSYLAASAAR